MLEVALPTSSLSQLRPCALRPCDKGIASPTKIRNIAAAKLPGFAGQRPSAQPAIASSGVAQQKKIPD